MEDRPLAPRSSRGARGEELRRHNLAALLEQLHLQGATSRSELTQLTGLNRSTIGGLVGELGLLGLAEESGVVNTPGPGRPSPLVRPVPRAAVALAVELTVDTIALATVGLGGTVLAERRVIRPRGALSPDAAVDQVVRQAVPLLRDLDADTIVGVGVAVAGMTNRTEGRVDLGPNLGWRDVPLRDLLTDGLTEVASLDAGTPILLANEADLGALAEHRRGAGRGSEHLVYVSGEVGIGVGIISSGVPILGASGYAGEAGHMLINPTGSICGCGARGCWETEAGEHALLRRAGVQPSSLGHQAVREVLTRAAAGEARAVQALADTGRWLGLGFGDLVNLFNPEVVVLGGLYHRLFEHIRPHVEDAVRARALGPPARTARIVASQLGEDGPLLGAAELAFTALLEDPAGSVRKVRAAT
jgi:predicted NBD/HSP70 family sugar kinase